MPLKYGYRRRFKPRFKRYNKANKRSMAMRKRYTPPRFNNFAPLGQRQAFRLKYVETVSVDPGVGTCTDYIFSANNLFDPNVSSTGHQPYGYDTLKLMWNHWCVVGSKIKVTCANSQTSYPIWVAVMLRDNATTLTGTDADELREQPGNKWKLLDRTPSGSSKNIVSKSFSARKFFGVKDIIADDTLSGAISTSPAEQAYYHVLIGPYGTSDDLSTQAFSVEIEFLAVFHEPAILGQS